MKVYRGFNNDIGPISYADWIYVTPDLEQAKWYANRDGQIKNGSVIQYDIDDNLNFFSIDNVNDVMKKYDESYTIDDLLWYQEGLSDYLYKEGADGIKFIDPKYNEHIIYILFDENYLKNGKILNKKPLKEAYIKGDKGNIYYTKNSDMFLSIIKNTFISKNIPVRVYYDTIKQIYVFGNAFDYIHADLATNMKYYSKVYGVDEMRANISYLKQNCALFQVLPDDDLKKYDMGDGYTHGWILPYEDMFFACRNNEYKKVRDEVPLFKDKVGFWQGTEYYEHQKSQQVVNESTEPKFNKNFWKWFKGSKVVDEKGKPLICYHGTTKKFKFFDKTKIGKRDKGWYGKGFYFTPDYDTAYSYYTKTYSGNYSKNRTVMPCYLSIKNPYIVDDWMVIQDKYGFKVEPEYLKNFDYSKYDGIIVYYSDWRSRKKIYEIIAFEPNQIKSVDNNGEWSDSNDIYESLTESVNDQLNEGIIEDLDYPDKNAGYYTYTDSDLLNILENKYKDLDTRIVYEFNKKVYLIGNSYSIIHNTLLEFAILSTNIFDSIPEISKGKESGEITQLIDDAINNNHLKLSTFKIFRNNYNYNDNDFIKYLKTHPDNNSDGYNDGYVCKINNILWAICRNDELDKTSQVPLLKNKKWINLDNKSLTESTENKILYIIRGVPGSGKSTLAHKLTDNVVEADQYFYDDEGNYNWSTDKLNQAHNWCYNTVKKYMEEGRDKIAVANTFVKKRDYKRYVELAEQFGYKVDIRVCNGNFKNIHGVPDETVEKMRAKFQLDESVLNDKVFYTRQLSRMLNICLNIGNARFIYIPEANLYVIGDAHNNTHISLFISALNEGKFDIGENDVDEYFDEYINSAEDTGAIITKKYANDENIWLKCPDTTNVINDYGKFYLCNGLCIEESLAKLTNTEPRFIKEKSYLKESVKLVNKNFADTKLITTPFELNEYLKNHTESRFVYDVKKKWYIVANAETSIHINLLNDALIDGIYEPFEYNGEMITGMENDYKGGKILYHLNPSRFWLFRTSKDPNDREDYYYDNYQYCYIYKDYCVFDRNGDFKRTPLYKFLGEPMDIDVFGDIDDEIYNGSEKELDESVKYLNKEYSDTRIITSNYDMRDYLNNHKNLRIVYDKLNKCYFINDSEKAVHFNIMSDAIKAGFYNDYGVISGMDLLLSNYYEQFVVFVVNDGSVPADVFDADDYTFEYKYDTFNIYDRDGQFINCPLYQILGMPNETNRIDGYNEDEDDEDYYDEDDEDYYDEDEKEQLDESAENDKTLRDYAVKLANICLDALIKTKYETKIAKDQVQINIDKAFKKAVPMLKNSPYEYFFLLVSEKDEPNPFFGKTIDKKYGFITFPIFSSNPSDLAFYLLFKHESTLNKLYSTYSGDELKLKMNEYASKYLKKELEKSLSNVKSEYLDILIHECTHLLDDVRRTKTYKSKKQELKDDKGIEDYFNSPAEQNAYYQETVSIFDEYAENKLVGYKTFDIFWDDFIRQYKGEYNMLNDKNKRKLKKRAYAYWYVYMKD